MEHWSREDRLDNVFRHAFRTNPKGTKDIQPFPILTSLKEPISRFGISLKELALKYGKDNKKVYIIPLRSFAHGLGQYIGRSSQDMYTQTTTDRITLGRTIWDCWMLDGTNKQGLKDFNNKYNDVIRGLLEGRLTYITVAVDNAGNHEFIGIFNAIQGALSPEHVFFTDKTDKYRTFNEIEGFDAEFYNELDKYSIISVMKLFKMHPLFLVPSTVDSDNFRFQF